MAPNKRPRGRPRGVEKIRINLKLRPEMDARLYEAAGRLGLTKSDYVDIDCRKDREPVSISLINVSWDRSRARHYRLVFRPLPVPMYLARIYRVA